MAQAAAPARSARRLAWVRRRATAARTWATFRRSKMGMAGLVILVFAVLVAIFAPFLAGLHRRDPQVQRRPDLCYPPGLRRVPIHH